MVLLPLLLAALVDGSERRQARLQELRGRLGEGIPGLEHGTNARLEWVRHRYGERVWDAILSTLAAHGVLVGGRSPRWDPVIPWLAREFYRNGPEVVAGTPRLLVSHRRLQALVDWAHATNPDLYRYDAVAADNAARAWHETFRAGGEVAPSSAKGGVPVYVWPDGWSMVRLVSPKQLAKEGEQLQHCVGGYWPDVREGRSVILSLRSPGGEPQVTVEVQPLGSRMALTGGVGEEPPFVIVQAQALDNNPPTGPTGSTSAPGQTRWA